MDAPVPQNSNKSRNEKTNQNIQVYVRVRPLNNRERMIRSTEVVDVVGARELVCRSSVDSKVTKKFSFDRSFGPNSKQSDVYQTVVAPLIEEVLAGYNCTVFAYGQTGTGKTHTMVGFENQQMKNSWEDDSLAGIIPRALCHMLDELRLMEVEYTMRISYLELYNEELCDLLSTDDSVKIRIFDDITKKGSIIIQGLEEVTIHGKDDIYKILEKGQERRKTATTLMNAQSSRSHTVLSILIHIKENGIDGEEMLKIGKLNLVDLAGSENISKAGNEKGIRTRETVNINQSLLTLGRVITALVERAPHVPYRESKLTRLLQESLGGRTKTSIIATISPGHKDLDETLSTLEYAHRAKNIQNKPELNQKLTKKTVLKEYIEEIDRLKKDLMAARDKNGIYLDEETYNEMNYKLDVQNKELNEKMLTLKALKTEMLKKEALFNEVSSNLIDKTEKLYRTEKVLSETKSNLTQTKKTLNSTKKRYKEKKILLGNHIKTEEKLTDQANQLIKVADIASNNHALLHATLERRKTADIAIKNVTEGFKFKMENSLKCMNENFQSLHEKHKSISDTIKNEFCNNTKVMDCCINETKTKIEGMVSHFEKASENFYSQYKEFAKEFSDADKRHLKSFKDLFHMQKERDEIWKEELNNYLHDASYILNEQKSVQKKNMNLFSELISKNNENEKKFCELVSCQLENIVEEAQKTINNEEEKIKVNAEKRKKLNKIKNELFTTILELEAQDQNDIEDDLKISENLLSIGSNFSSKINHEVEIIKKYANEKGNELKKIQSDLETIQRDSNSYISKIQSQIGKLENSILGHNEKIYDFRNKMNKLLLVNYENRADLLMKTDNTLINIKGDSYTSTQSQFKESQNFICENQLKFNEFSIQNTSMIQSLAESVNDYANAFHQNINSNHEYLTAFSENELKVYKPTGQTPSKTEYIYPKILAHTSPHAAILKRFRLENGYSDVDISNSTITEDNESVIFNIIEEMPRISTPIKQRLDGSTKSFNLNTPSLVENNSRLTHSLDIYDKKNYNELGSSSAHILTTNKENIK